MVGFPRMLCRRVSFCLVVRLSYIIVLALPERRSVDYRGADRSPSLGGYTWSRQLGVMLYMLGPCRNCRSSAFYSFSQRLRFMVYFIPIPFSCQPKGNGGKPARSVICHTLSGGAHSFLSLLGSFPGKEAEVEKGRIYVFLNSPWLCKCMCYRVTIILYRILPLLPGYNNLPRTTVP